MSASNWEVCPRCLRTAKANKAALERRVAESYGKVSVEQFDAMREEAAKPIAEEALRTFREDYEQFVTEDGVYKCYYTGHCKTCGLHFEHQHEELFMEAVGP